MSAEPDTPDNTLARLKFGLHELEHGVGKAIPEPLGAMLGALVRWRVGLLEQEQEEQAIEDRIIEVHARQIDPED